MRRCQRRFAGAASNRSRLGVRLPLYGRLATRCDVRLRSMIPPSLKAEHLFLGHGTKSLHSAAIPKIGLAPSLAAY